MDRNAQAHKAFVVPEVVISAVPLAVLPLLPPPPPLRPTSAHVLDHMDITADLPPAAAI
jgi:hypothetical protein